MANIITPAEFATWCQATVEAINADAYALMVMDLVSAQIVAEAGRPDWDGPLTTPVRVKLMALVVGRRAYLNPDQEVAQAVAGGPSVRMIDAAAAGVYLTDEEKTELARLAAIDDPNPSPFSPDLWVLPTGGGELEKPLFLADNSGSDWLIPYLDPARDPWYFPTMEDQS
jgi:hypothetical protein